MFSPSTSLEHTTAKRRILLLDPKSWQHAWTLHILNLFGLSSADSTNAAPLWKKSLGPCRGTSQSSTRSANSPVHTQIKRTLGSKVHKFSKKVIVFLDSVTSPRRASTLQKSKATQERQDAVCYDLRKKLPPC